MGRPSESAAAGGTREELGNEPTARDTRSNDHSTIESNPSMRTEELEVTVLKRLGFDQEEDFILQMTGLSLGSIMDALIVEFLLKILCAVVGCCGRRWNVCSKRSFRNCSGKRD